MHLNVRLFYIMKLPNPFIYKSIHPFEDIKDSHIRPSASLIHIHIDMDMQIRSTHTDTQSHISISTESASDSREFSLSFSSLTTDR